MKELERVSKEREPSEDDVEKQLPIPVLLLQASVSAAESNDDDDQTQKEEETIRKQQQALSPDCEKKRVANLRREGTPRREANDNDTSWGKIKKRTSPVVNASLVLFYSVLSAMLIFGWVSINSCTVNRLIPVYLIVAGSTGILTKALIHTRNKYLFNVVILLVLFNLVWQAFGSYLVYTVYQPNYDPLNGKPYCHRIAYLLAFWIITIVYSLIGLFVLLSCCYFLMRNTFRKPT